MEQVPGQDLTLGIDLSSQPTKTAACLIDWAVGSATLVLADEGRGLDDQTLLKLLGRRDVTKVGIDVPLGWPLGFVDALSTYRDGGAWPPLETRELRFRATEFRVKGETGQQPLSVAIGDLAWPAIRCARLLAQLPDRPVDRSGRGWLAEVYPMVALRRWKIIPPGAASKWSYKGDDPVRQARREKYLTDLLDQLAESVSVTAGEQEAFARNDDAFDAFVCALIARAAHRGVVDEIPPGLAWAALREGWIQLPTADSLGRLSD